jgi:hypothetical protein
MQKKTCLVRVVSVCVLNKPFTTPSLNMVRKNEILTAIIELKGVEPDSRQT